MDTATFYVWHELGGSGVVEYDPATGRLWGCRPPRWYWLGPPPGWTA